MSECILTQEVAYSDAFDIGESECPICLKPSKAKGGWDGCPLCTLEQKLLEEVAEYCVLAFGDDTEIIRRFVDAVQEAEASIDDTATGTPCPNSKNKMKELVDIANVSMMLWDVERKNQDGSIKVKNNGRH